MTAVENRIAFRVEAESKGARNHPTSKPVLLMLARSSNATSQRPITTEVLTKTLCAIASRFDPFVGITFYIVGIEQPLRVWHEISVDETLFCGCPFAQFTRSDPLWLSIFDNGPNRQTALAPDRFARFWQD